MRRLTVSIDYRSCSVALDPIIRLVGGFPRTFDSPSESGVAVDICLALYMGRSRFQAAPLKKEAVFVVAGVGGEGRVLFPTQRGLFWPARMAFTCRSKGLCLPFEGASSMLLYLTCFKFICRSRNRIMLSRSQSATPNSRGIP